MISNMCQPDHCSHLICLLSTQDTISHAIYRMQKYVFIVQKSVLWLDKDNSITTTITTKLHLLTPATKEELEGNSV